MATDAWHHVEGTYPQNGLFRVLLLRQLHQAAAAEGKGVTAASRSATHRTSEIARLRSPRQGRRDMEAKIPPRTRRCRCAQRCKPEIQRHDAEQPFDFQFNEYSKDAARRHAVGPTATPRTTSAPAAPKPAAAPPAAAAASPLRCPGSSWHPRPPAPAATDSAAGARPSQPPDCSRTRSRRCRRRSRRRWTKRCCPRAIPELVGGAQHASSEVERS